ncbi:DUF2249 domain-containing protein [Parapedobacter sp. 10938]|uniref:DUF2249 domain-containing protein n=1 Tax=Parapedobacter flavus TaxID=3110225 RepID=UPI002DB9874E|nr:DUF2249 domain-containing protein [Parapedobacter sp. 10938]MEC3879488.1 DUF2249 domain-containing protein [Parapedobacter sp. 10938]
MVINEHTRVSEVIKANADSIAAIAALAKPLRKLNNPLLRRVMAPRVTLAEAAAIGGCALADIRAALEPLGFHFAADKSAAGPEIPKPTQQPDWLAGASATEKDLFDVRGIIESGDDPLKAIVQRYRALPPGNLLCIINSFIPYPLLSLLEKKGAISYVETVATNEHHTWFFKPGAPQEETETAATDRVVMHDGPSFGQVLEAYPEARRVQLDVRPLPMPQPMETILETLPTLAPNQVLYVQHKRVPLHLLEELADQAYTAHIHEVDEGDVRMLIVSS